MPAAVRYAIGRGYGLLPIRWRLGAAYGQFTQLAAIGADWTAEECWAYQLSQLRTVLRHAADSSPFYQRSFARAAFHPDSLHDPEDLQACPTLGKEDLQRHLPEIASTALPASARLHITTGGSTGTPVGFYLHKGVSRPKEQAFLETMWQRAGYSAGARLAVIRGHVTSSRAAGRIADYDASRQWLLLSSYHLTANRLPDYLEALERFKPDFLHAYPSAALQLAEFLEKSGQTSPLKLRAVLCGSERLTLPQKRLLERVFRCRVYRWYGHAERVVLAGEGAGSELFYFFPQYGFVEFGPPDEEGLQEVIGTSFHNLAMPLIRYRTGDRALLAEPARSPAREFSWTAVVDIAGRDQEFLVSAAGRRISLTAFNMHDRIFDHLYAVQFYQDQPGVTEFRYVAAPEFRTSRLPSIEAGIRQKLGEDFQIVFRRVDAVDKTAGGKHRWLVSHLPESRIP